MIKVHHPPSCRLKDVHAVLTLSVSEHLLPLLLQSEMSCHVNVTCHTTLHLSLLHNFFSVQAVFICIHIYYSLLGLLETTVKTGNSL